MRTLIAGLGNIFASDDGFGSAVAAALAELPEPPGAEVVDFGIRGVHLAYQLLDGYDLVVIIDAVSRGGEPGTLYVIEHGADADRPPAEAEAAAEPGAVPLLDAHDMAPDEVLAMVPTLGGSLGRVVIVGCEPELLATGMGLSPAVARSVEPAAQLALQIVREAGDAAAPRDRLRIGGR